MSLVGFGRLGLRSGIVPYEEFQRKSSTSKVSLIELRPYQRISSWDAYGGNVWQAGAELDFAGMQRDIVAVKTGTQPELVRVESLALCGTTANSFYYDPDTESGDAFWDDNVSTWSDDEQAPVWDEFRRLYVNLDGDNPNSEIVVAAFGLHYATERQRHPHMSGDRLTDGSFENWDDTETPSDWTQDLDTGGYSLQDDEELPPGGGSGLYSCKLGVDGTQAAGAEATVYEAQTVIVDGVYRISGCYRTPEDLTTGVVACASLWDATNGWSESDGRSYGAALTAELEPTRGAWRHFVFDVVARATSVRVALTVKATNAGDVGHVHFDGVAFQRIWRFYTYAPRLQPSPSPSSDMGSNDVYFGGKRIGVGSISLWNADGHFDKLYGNVQWINANVLIRSGGAYADAEGTVVPLTHEDTRAAFPGLVQKVLPSDTQFRLELQDTRAFFGLRLPLRTFDESEYPDIERQSLGKPRPYWFGAVENITPIGREKTANNYRLYELADCERSPAGLKAIDIVFAYADAEAAGIKDTSRRRTLVEGDDYEVDLANGTLTVLRDVGPYEVDATRNQIDFDIGGGDLLAQVATGLYSAEDLADEIATKMTTAAGTAITCTYSETDHKFTIAKASGTLNLQTNTGANQKIAVWETIGFDQGTDKTGSLSYEGDAATFEDPDVDHVLRVDGDGFKDDASGTYTGSSGALIDIGADIAQVVWHLYAKRPYSLIDLTSFEFARSRAPESLALYLREAVSIKDIFDRLEFSNIANISVDGEGRIYYEVYVGEVPASAPTLYDSDYLSFDTVESVSDVYAKLNVKYNRDPTTGEYRSQTAEQADVPVLYGRPESRDFETYIKRADNASAAATRMAALARPVRRYTFSVKGVITDSRVGQKVILNKRRVFDVTGGFTDHVVRILSIRKDHATGINQATCIDDVVTVAGIACLSECQATCEGGHCQIACEIACVDTCESSGRCQVDCEASCQQGCQLGVCQATCEKVCKNCEGVSCEDACESVCQDCQTSCQQGSCQNQCEITGTCQTTCQLNVCQTCQDACQSACKTACEVSCQESCQLTCKNACQYNCTLPSECDITCQGSYQ